MNGFSCPAFPFADPEAPHLMRDGATGDWVIIAPGRRVRPDGLKKRKDVFSPSSLPVRDIIATYGRGEHAIRVVKNKYPIFFPDRSFGGDQEILVEGNRAMPFWDSTPERIVALLGAFQKRFRILRKRPDIKYLQAFKNEGRAAGSSQPHPHSQIFALSFVPEHIRDMAKRRRASRVRGESLHGRAMREATPERVIFSDRRVVAFAHPSGRFAYEARIVPRKPHDNITALSPAEIRSSAEALRRLLPLMKQKKAAYNLYFHDVKDETDEHFEIRFTPRLNIWGGFELDAGVAVNPVPAECAAHEYRNA